MNYVTNIFKIFSPNLRSKFVMSTFGKKSLGWWNYEDHSKLNVVRYNHTPIELQLSILEKWYPIGLLFRKSYTSARIYKIIGYKQISSL